MSESVEKILKEIVALPLSSVAHLVKRLKEDLGLPDTPFFTGSSPQSSQSHSVESDVKDVKSEFVLFLKGSGEKKANVIKAVKDILKKLGKDVALKDVKDLVESAPVALSENLPKDDADSYLKTLKDAGADAELK